MYVCIFVFLFVSFTPSHPWNASVKQKLLWKSKWHGCAKHQSYGIGVVRSRRILSGARFLTTQGVVVKLFVRLWLRKPNWIIFSHHTPKLGIPVEMVQIFIKLLLKQRIIPVYHDFHWVLVATKFLTAKHHSFMLKSPSRQFLKGRSRGGSRKFWKSRSWSKSRTFYLRRLSPAQHTNKNLPFLWISCKNDIPLQSYPNDIL